MLGLAAKIAFWTGVAVLAVGFLMTSAAERQKWELRSWDPENRKLLFQTAGIRPEQEDSSSSVASDTVGVNPLQLDDDMRPLQLDDVNPLQLDGDTQLSVPETIPPTSVLRKLTEEEAHIKSFCESQPPRSVIVGGPADYNVSDPKLAKAGQIIDAYLDQTGLRGHFGKYRDSLAEVLFMYDFNEMRNYGVTDNFIDRMYLAVRVNLASLLAEIREVSLTNFQLSHLPKVQLMLLFRNMRRLNLRGTGLTEADLTGFSFVEEIHLDENRLTSFPKLPCRPSSLRCLFVVGSGLSGVVSFGDVRLMRIWMLDLIHNEEITEIEGLSAAMPNLTHIYLDRKHKDKLGTWLAGYSGGEVTVTLFSEDEIEEFKWHES